MSYICISIHFQTGGTPSTGLHFFGGGGVPDRRATSSALDPVTFIPRCLHSALSSGTVIEENSPDDAQVIVIMIVIEKENEK